MQVHRLMHGCLNRDWHNWIQKNPCSSSPSIKSKVNCNCFSPLKWRVVTRGPGRFFSLVVKSEGSPTHPSLDMLMQEPWRRYLSNRSLLKMRGKLWEISKNTLPKTNSLHLKHWEWKMSFLLRRSPRSCYVSFREGFSNTLLWKLKLSPSAIFFSSQKCLKKYPLKSHQPSKGPIQLLGMIPPWLPDKLRWVEMLPITLSFQGNSSCCQCWHFLNCLCIYHISYYLYIHITYNVYKYTKFIYLSVPNEYRHGALASLQKAVSIPELWHKSPALQWKLLSSIWKFTPEKQHDNGKMTMNESMYFVSKTVTFQPAMLVNPAFTESSGTSETQHGYFRIPPIFATVDGWNPAPPGMYETL